MPPTPTVSVDHRPDEDRLRCDLYAPLPPGGAYLAFAPGLDRWWPPAYTWSGDALVRLALEPWSGGHLFEIGPDGFRCDWGTVLAWEPPQRLRFRWQIAPSRAPEPDPARGSVVEVRFVADGTGTRLRLEHRGFRNHGDGGDAYREALASDQGWPWMLRSYLEALG